MSFVAHLNQSFKVAIGGRKVVIYGQNVSTGSCLSGLSRGFDKIDGCHVINTPNSELTLTGMGFGLMLKGVSSIFFMKQLDFLLLGIEQLTDTWNAIRRRAPDAAFTIVPIIVDSGWEGPQSCLNHLADVSSLSRIPGFTLTTRAEADAVIAKHATAPGVRIIAPSQRLFRDPPLDYGTPQPLGPDCGVVRYADGADLAIVALNLAFPEAMAVHRHCVASNLSAALFSVPATSPEDLSPILDAAARSGRVLLIDDGKSVNAASNAMIAAIRDRDPAIAIHRHARVWTPDAAAPNADRLAVDPPALLRRLGVAATMRETRP